MKTKIVARPPQRTRPTTCPAAVPVPSNADEGSRFFSDAVIDNFASVDLANCTWNQRYYVNASQCEANGCPVFVYIGGEGPLSPYSVGDGLFMTELAEEHGALVVALEHRYFGFSWPTAEMDNEQLKAYLSSEQALADLARFRSWFSEDATIEERGTNHSLVSSDFVAFGGSYPGNLAAWIQTKYSQLFRGTVASSAPITAVAEWPGYLQVVGSALRHFGGDDCFEAVKHASSKVVEMLNDGKRDDIATLFNTCTRFDNTSSAQDVSVLLQSIVDGWSTAVQYNRPWAANSVKTYCDRVTASMDDPNKLLVAFANVTMTQNGGGCTDVSMAETIAELSDTTLDGVRSGRQWYFMCCNEFGFWQVAGSDANKDPFAAFQDSVDLASFQDSCTTVFDITTSTPPTDWSNTKYGLPETIAAQNVTFPSGSLDPWHVLGVTNASRPMKIKSERAVFIPFTSHCQDMSRCTDDMCKVVPQIQWAQGRVRERVAFYLDASHDKPSPSRHSSATVVAGVSAGIGGLLIGGLIGALAVRTWQRRPSTDGNYASFPSS